MPEFSNALRFESSPYLLQHAHNPVEWYAWSAETLALARKRNLPVLVSIGYAACHWCHVMEKESFENVSVANYMNQHFTNIKIDREERPDIDHLMMEAVQAMGVSGGWPLNVFLTPDLKPFYGGTYFPPERRHHYLSWLEVLQAVHHTWEEKNDDVQQQAESLLQHLQSATSQLTESSKPDIDFHATTQKLLSRADKTWGGFGGAPKFPGWFVLRYLMQYAYFQKDETAMQHVHFSLKNLCAGGIYDQVGGGIARYSTDVYWLAPHFEKMLYDNAFLIQLLSEAYQLSGDPFYETYILKTMEFLKREMRSDDGGYYASLDADSEGVEGKFYVWSFDEIKNILGEDASAFMNDLGVKEEGNWEGNNILHYNDKLLSRADVQTIPVKWESAFKQLLEVRSQRVRPATDTKILLGWNALLLKAYCTAYAALQHDGIREEAIQLYRFIDKHFKNGKQYLHVYGKQNIPAFLDDYAYLIEAGISLHNITGDSGFIQHCRALAQYVFDEFYNAEAGMFNFSFSDMEDGLWNFRDLYDNAQPSGNSVMAENLVKLGTIFPEEKWLERGEDLLDKVRAACERYPEAFANWLSVYYQKEVGIMEISIEEAGFNTMLREISKIYLPNNVLKPNIGSQKNRGSLPEGLISGKFIVCTQLTCLPPMGSTQELKNFIRDNLGIKST